VAFKTQEQAEKAKKGLNGRMIVSGSEPIKVDSYNAQNKFPGLFRGLDPTQLVNNTHFRVLFLKGLDKQLSKSELRSMCDQYGSVDVLTLKTTIDDGTQVSKGIAIVQFTTQDGAATALRNLPFEQRLGDPKQVQIDFYESLESRLLSQADKYGLDPSDLESGPGPSSPTSASGSVVLQALLKQ